MLYGRGAERTRIGELLDGAREARSAVLVLRGEAGIGKSALLGYARERATGMRVLSARGVESESALAFAGLHQLVRPVLRHVAKLPGPQAAALQGALGLGDGGGDDRFLISAGALTLLADAAEQRPLLCLVDDAHWIDAASADALVFAARRLAVERIAMLFAARESERRGFAAAGLPELRLGGLAPEDAGALLDSNAGGGLSPTVRERLLNQARGNPLGLLELPAALSGAQLSGAEPLPAPLPVGARVEHSFRATVRRLPEPTRTLLLVAAADDTGRWATVLRAARGLGAGAEALDAAEQAGLVRVRGTRLEFRHPLVRSAIYQAAPLSQRHAAHRALAGALDGDAEADRRAWHRAAAAIEPDASVIAELEQAAERARRRSSPATASQAYERAAALTGDSQPRARRLVAAAEDAWWAGQPERTLELLDRARTLDADPIVSADIARWRGLVEMHQGVAPDARDLLVRAAAAVAPLDGDRALYLLGLASVAGAYAGDDDANVAIARAAGQLPAIDSAIGRLLREFLVAVGAHFAGDFAGAAPGLRRALAAAGDGAALAEQPALLLFAGRPAIFLGDDAAAHRMHKRAVERARDSGALSILVQALPRLAHGEIWAGRWRSAAANAAEGLELASAIGQRQLMAHLLVVRALIAALRGDEDECRAAALEGRDLAAGQRAAVHVDLSDWALVVLELGLGRADEALARARDIARSPAVLWAALDRVEAAVRGGEPDTAAAWLAPYAEWAESTAMPWAQAVAMHGRALLADGDEALRLFAGALDAHERAARPFERARTELAFGEWLRRARRRVEAREHLRAALAGFEALGAGLWAERARVELRASGQSARRRDPSTLDDLTTQELQVARFVAQGLTNREVASRLFLSPRTIDFHLRNVFAKLGISSRTQLARLDLELAGEPALQAGP